MGKIRRNYIYSAAYQILTILTPIITAPYLARVLGADNLGIYSYVNSSGNIVTTIALLGIYAYGNRQAAYVRDDRDKLTQVFWDLMLTRLLLGLAGTVIYLVYSGLNPDLRLYFLLYYPYILAQFLDCSWVYVGIEDMKPAVMKNFAAKIINICGIFLLVRERDDVWIYILLLAVTALVANLSIYTQLPKYIGKARVSVKSIPGYVKGSLYLFLPQVASLLYLQVDKVMLKWLTGTTNQVAFYDNAEKIVTIPLSLITVISTVMMPRIANEYQKGHRTEINRLLVKAGKYSLFMACPMMLGMLCIARQFIPWYLGEEFFPSAQVMMMLVPIVLFNSLAGISGSQYFTATDQIGIILKAYVTAAAANILINALTIPRFGSMGAAAATVVSSLLSVCIQYWYLDRQMSIRSLGRDLLRYLAAAAAMAAVVFAVSARWPAGAATTVLQAGIGTVVYFGLMAACKDEVFRELVGWLKCNIKQRKNRGNTDG